MLWAANTLVEEFDLIMFTFKLAFISVRVPLKGLKAKAFVVVGSLIL